MAEAGYGSCLGVLVPAACEAREATKRFHADIAAVHARRDRSCVLHMVSAVCKIKARCAEAAEDGSTPGQDQVCKRFRKLARSDKSAAQAAHCGDKGRQTLRKQGAGVGMGQLVGQLVQRGPTLPNRQNGGAEMDTENNACGTGEVVGGGATQPSSRKARAQEDAQGNLCGMDKVGDPRAAADVC